MHERCRAELSQNFRNYLTETPLACGARGNNTGFTELGKATLKNKQETHCMRLDIS